MDQLTEFPSEIVAGDYFNLKESLSDYPASESWGLTYVLINSSDNIKITLTGSASGDDHLIQVAATTTADYEAGFYDWQKRISDGTNVHTIDTGQTTVVANFSAADTLDIRSHVKKTLDALEATILGKADKDQSSYSVGGRSIARMSPTELLEWRDKYRAEYRSELVKAGKITSRKNIKSRFVRIS